MRVFEISFPVEISAKLANTFVGPLDGALSTLTWQLESVVDVGVLMEVRAVRDVMVCGGVVRESWFRQSALYVVKYLEFGREVPCVVLCT